jgi:hypothetical protein
MSAPVNRHGIVVGVDGSPASNAAVCWAARDAAMRNVPLTLVHAYNTYVPTFPQIPLSAGVALFQEEDGRQVLEQAVKIAEDAVKADQNIAIASELNAHPPCRRWSICPNRQRWSSWAATDAERWAGCCWVRSVRASSATRSARSRSFETKTH